MQHLKYAVVKHVIIQDEIFKIHAQSCIHMLIELSQVISKVLIFTTNLYLESHKCPISSCVTDFILSDNY